MRCSHLYDIAPRADRHLGPGHFDRDAGACVPSRRRGLARRDGTQTHQWSRRLLWLGDPGELPGCGRRAPAVWFGWNVWAAVATVSWCHVAGQYCACVVDESQDEPLAEQLLRIMVRHEADAIVVIVEGDVDMLTVGRLRAAVDEALRDAVGRPVVVDLTAVTYLGSHGLAALAEAASKAEWRREPLRVVVDETRAVIRPLQVSGLDEVLTLYYSVGDALPQ